MNPTVIDDLIFDVGAHKGEDSDFYLRMGYRVVAVEANPGLADYLRQRFAEEIARGQYVVVSKAIDKSSGTVTFYVNSKRSVWGTADPEWAERNRRMGFESREVTVPSVTFDSVLKEHGCPLYLKIDIEGADLLCVNALATQAVRPKYLSIESNKTSWRGLVREFKILRDLGYTRFQVVNQRKHKPGTFTSRDGSAISYVFKGGESGPFGPYLPGRWLSYPLALLHYVPIFVRYKTLGDNTWLARKLSHTPLLWRLPNSVSWYDTHAR